MSSVDYSVQTAAYTGEEPPLSVLEKQPAIGQLQLKEFLSGTSMRIVEYAQKLAEAPLIGTLPDGGPAPAKATAAVAGQPLTVGDAQTKKSSATQLITAAPTEDRFPGPDHPEDGPMSARMQAQSMMNTVTVQEDETADAEPYEAYCFPEGLDKMERVPAILRKYVQLFQDEKTPIAKIFKLEDEEKLNEAVCMNERKRNFFTENKFYFITKIQIPTMCGLCFGTKFEGA